MQLKIWNLRNLDELFVFALDYLDSTFILKVSLNLHYSTRSIHIAAGKDGFAEEVERAGMAFDCSTFSSRCLAAFLSWFCCDLTSPCSGKMEENIYSLSTCWSAAKRYASLGLDCILQLVTRILDDDMPRDSPVYVYYVNSCNETQI